MKKPKILTIGNIYIDIDATGFPFGDEGISTESENIGTRYELSPGGSAVNFAKICQSLGIDVVLVGKIGDDNIGRMALDLFKSMGIQAELIIDPGTQSNVSFNMVNDNGRTIMNNAGSANQQLNAEELYEHASKYLEYCTHLYIGGCFKVPQLLPALLNLAKKAKRNGLQVILDHNRIPSEVSELTKEEVKEIAEHSDYYLPSCDEFKELWNVDSIDKGIENLSKSLSSTVVVKDSKNGVFSLSDEEVIRMPTFDVEPINTVGAGDSFNAGFIAGILQDKDLKSSIEYGNAVASLKISQARIASKGQVENFLDNRPPLLSPDELIKM
jgi:sugar/nucleoside kinase (ribokinase family)